MSPEELITANLEARLRMLTVTNGFSCDAGDRVYQNLEYSTVSDVRPCLIYYPGEITSGIDGDVPPCLGELNNNLPIVIEGFVDDQERGEAGDQLKRDICTLIRRDQTFGGNAEMLSNYQIKSSATPQDGGDSGFFSVVRIEFSIFYVTAV